MRCLLLALTAMAASAAVVYSPAACSGGVCTVTVTCAAATCTGTEATELQAALDNTAVLCGSTYVLEAGRRWTATTGFAWTRAVACGGNPITIRTSAVSSLPAPGSRIATAYAAYLPTLACSSALGGLEISRGVGITIRGVAFAGVAGCDGFRVLASSSVLGDLPDQIKLQHVYVWPGPIRHGLMTNGRAITIEDSYVEAAWSADAVENKAIVMWDGPGPVVVRNSYLSAAGIHALIGGSPPLGRWKPTAIFEGNTFFKPPSLCALQGSITVKNAVETKSCADCQFNFNWIGNTCQGNDQRGQALAINSRLDGIEYGAVPATASTDNLTVNGHLLVNGDKVVLSGTLPGGLTGCGTSSSGCFVVGAAANTFHLSATFGGAALNITADGTVSVYEVPAQCGSWRTTVRGNYIDGAHSGFSILGDDSNLAAGLCRNSGIVFEHNFVRLSAAMDSTPPSGLNPQSVALIGGGLGHRISRNTFFSTDGQAAPPASSYLMNMDGAADSELVVDGNIAQFWAIGIKRSGATAGGPSIDAMSAAARVAGNVFGGGSALTCTAPRVCGPNTLPTAAQWDSGIVEFRDAAAADFRLASTSPYRQTAGGEPAGADMSLVPWVLPTVTTPAAGSIRIDYELSPVLRQATCRLEVWTNDYRLRPHNVTPTIVAPVDPAITPRADLDDGSNAAVTRTTALRRVWALSGLAAGTRYWALTCGGAMRTGSVVVP